MNKATLFTGIIGVIVGATGMLAYTAKAPTGHQLQPTHTMLNHDDMTMGDMVTSLEGKNGTEFDLAFVRGMIPHHQGAIDMATLALDHAGHEEIKTMARDIIDAQQREIDMMRVWEQAWQSPEGQDAAR